MSNDVIKWFIGTSANGEDIEAELTLEYSARKLCSMPIDIVWMRQAAKGPFSGWNMKSARTPFSSYRWAPPALCNYEGRSIYTDVDFLMRADLAELWNQPIPNVLLAKVGKKGFGKSCCMLFDNAKAKGHIPDLATLKKMPDAQGEMSNYFKAHPELSSAFAGDWNAIDLKGYEDINDPRIKAIHFSRMELQMHLAYAVPRLKKEGKTHWYTGPTGPHDRKDLIALFDELYHEALAAGYTIDQYRVDNFGGATRRNFTYTHSRVTA